MSYPKHYVDEIKRERDEARARVAELEAWAEDRVKCATMHMKTAANYKVERDRLREALERIEAEAYEMGPTTWGLSEIARAALKETDA